MDAYPRYTIFRAASGQRVVYRVSVRRAEDVFEMCEAARIPYQTRAHMIPPRFRIKIAKWPTNRPIILKDATRRGFRGQYRNLEDACRAMDNRIRLERGMPERIDWAHFRPVTPHVEAASA